MIDVLDDTVSMKLYADDAKLYGCPNEGSTSIQASLDRVVNFMSEWQLKVNAEKCHVIHTGNNN